MIDGQTEWLNNVCFKVGFKVLGEGKENNFRQQCKEESQIKEVKRFYLTVFRICVHLILFVIPDSGGSSSHHKFSRTCLDVQRRWAAGGSLNV